MNPTIAIINESTVVTDAKLQAIVAALQIQVDRDFEPIWNKGCSLVFVGKHHSIPASAWQLGIFDTSDQAGALGYHDVTHSGQPLGKVFAKDDLKYGSSLPVTISHELLEMLADPEIDQIVSVNGPKGSGRVWQRPLEDCDAVEDDSLGYLINGVLVSDFVTPAWFKIGKPKDPAKRYDFMGKCTKPFQLLAGGYIGMQLILNDVPQGWTQVTARKGEIKPSHTIHRGSRRHRRHTKYLWGWKLSNITHRAIV